MLATDPMIADAGRVVLGIGGLAVRRAAAGILVTHALGSCVGIAVYDPTARIGGMVHAQLPLSNLNPDRARQSPSLFVDLGMQMLFQAMSDLGSERRHCRVTVAGGACISTGASDLFEIGKRNLMIARKMLWQLGIAIAEPGHTMPAPRAEPASAARDDPALGVYARRCALCHGTTLAHPPNFLHGDPAQVETRIDHCAERMYARLDQANRPEAEQPVAPMPPPAMVGTAPAGWLTSPDFTALREDLAARITRQGGDPHAVLRQPYASLRGCLPYADMPSTPEHAHAPAL